MKYKITGNVNIRHNGKFYKQGSMIELEKRYAERLKSYLKPVKAKSKDSTTLKDDKQTETEINKGDE